MGEKPIKVDEETDRLVSELAYLLGCTKKSVVREAVAELAQARRSALTRTPESASTSVRQRDATTRAPESDATSRAPEGDATTHASEGDATTRARESDASARARESDASARAPESGASTHAAEGDATTRARGSDASARASAPGTPAPPARGRGVSEPSGAVMPPGAVVDPFERAATPPFGELPLRQRLALRRSELIREFARHGGTNLRLLGPLAEGGDAEELELVADTDLLDGSGAVPKLQAVARRLMAAPVHVTSTTALGLFDPEGLARTLSQSRPL